jgi:hypothetical protein
MLILLILHHHLLLLHPLNLMLIMLLLRLLLLHLLNLMVIVLLLRLLLLSAESLGDHTAAGCFTASLLFTSTPHPYFPSEIRTFGFPASIFDVKFYIEDVKFCVEW